MKILFVLEHFYPYLGGAEHLFWTLAKALVKKGCKVAVVTTRFKKDLPKVEHIEGISIHRVDCYNRFLFSFFSLPVILRLLPEYEIVHTTSYNAALPAWVAARLRKKPAVITFHEVWGKLWWELPYASFLARTAFYYWEQLLLRLSFNKFIAVSEFTKNALVGSGVDPDKVIRIYNGMDYNDFEGYAHQPPSQFTFTYFGRLGISKGLDLLLPAAATHFKKYPDSRLKLIIPTYPKNFFNRIKEEIKALDIETNVQYLHHLPRTQLFEEITNSSCIVIPSYSEGFCFVAAETVALGVPIISSHQGALPEVVGGKHIHMSEQNTSILEMALGKAIDEKWETTPIIKYLLSEAVTSYIKLYENLKNA